MPGRAQGQGSGSDREGARISEHASRASALLAARANAVKEASGAKPAGAAKRGASGKPGVSGKARAGEGGASGPCDAPAADGPAARFGTRPSSSWSGSAHLDDPMPYAESDERPVGRQGRPESLAEFVKRNIGYIASAVIVIILVAAGMVALGVTLSVSSGRSAEGDAYVSPYDWTRLDRADGRYRYLVDGEPESRLGIDVSENQHEIDWQAVAADGIEFAMIRVGYRGATEGDLYLDEQYWANIDGARDAGLDVGAYFFSQARTPDEAVEEAEFVLEYLNGAPLAYPVAFDSEEVVLSGEKSRTNGLTGDEMTAIAEAFCERIGQAGYATAIYGNAADLSRYRRESLERYPVWRAEYGTPVPAANVDIAYWQYSNTGQVAGIPVPVDMNIDLTGVLD